VVRVVRGLVAHGDLRRGRDRLDAGTLRRSRRRIDRLRPGCLQRAVPHL
jgi:hypothetical protein